MKIRKPILKSLLCYPTYFYWYLLPSNLLLRLSWTYKLSPHLRVNFNTVMMFTLLEVHPSSPPPGPPWGPTHPAEAEVGYTLGKELSSLKDGERGNIRSNGDS